MKQYQEDCSPPSAPLRTTTNQSQFINTCSLPACKTSKFLATPPQKPHNTTFGKKEKKKKKEKTHKHKKQRKTSNN